MKYWEIISMILIYSCEGGLKSSNRKCIYYMYVYTFAISIWHDKLFSSNLNLFRNFWPNLYAKFLYLKKKYIWHGVLPSPHFLALFYNCILNATLQVGWELEPTPSANGTLFCSFCGKEYPHISALRQHMPVHTGEKKFKCTGCDRRFTQSSSLYKHMKKANCGAMQELGQSRWHINT